MAVYSIVAQLGSARAFLETQAPLLQPEVQEAHIMGMCKGIETHINNLRALQYEAANEINTATASSPFSDVLKASLAKAVAGRVMQSHAVLLTGQGLPKRGTQTLSNPLAYFRHADWAYWGVESKTPNQRVQYLVPLLVKLGLLNPTEQTVRKLVGMIAALSFPSTTPEPKTLHAIVLDLKASIDIYRGGRTGPHLLEYPADPINLPEEIKMKAYDGDLSDVVDQTLPRFEEFCMLTILRGNHHLLRSGSNQTFHQHAALPMFASSPPQSVSAPGPAANMIGQLLQRLLSAGAHHCGPSYVGHEPHIVVSPEWQDKQPTGSCQAVSPNWQHAARDSAAALPSSSSAQAPTTAIEKENDIPAEETKAKNMVALMEDAVVQATKPSKNEGPAIVRARVLKRPACCISRGSLPKVPADKMGTTVVHNGGKIHVSLKQQCYRVFKQTGDRCYLKVKWSTHPSRQAAWDKALSIIDEARK